MGYRRGGRGGHHAARGEQHPSLRGTTCSSLCAARARGIIDIPAALGPPDEEEGYLRTISLRGELATLRLGRVLLERVQVMGCMGHAIWVPRLLQHATRLEDRTATRTQGIKTPSEALFWPAANPSDEPTWGCNVCPHHPDGPKQANIRAREDQSPGFDADSLAHPALWPGPGTVTAKHGAHLDTAPLLEGEERRRAIRSSEQAAAPTTSSNFNTLKSPPLHAQATPAAPERAPDPHIPSVQPCGSSRTHIPSRIERNLNPQPSERLAQSGTHAPRLAPSLQRPEAFVEDPGEPGGVRTVQDGAPAPLEVSEAMQLASAAESTDPGAFALARSQRPGVA